jgi:hypothetical protein
LVEAFHCLDVKAAGCNRFDHCAIEHQVLAIVHRDEHPMSAV